MTPDDAAAKAGTSPQPNDDPALTQAANTFSRTAGASHERLHTTALTALVASIVTLVLSPIADSLSFVVNDYLARPLLAIEYVETVPLAPPVPLPAAAIRALLMPPAYRAIAMSGYRPGEQLIDYQARDSGNTEDVESVTQALLRLEGPSTPMRPRMNVA